MFVAALFCTVYTIKSSGETLSKQWRRRLLLFRGARDPGRPRFPVPVCASVTSCERAAARSSVSRSGPCVLLGSRRIVSVRRERESSLEPPSDPDGRCPRALRGARVSWVASATRALTETDREPSAAQGRHQCRRRTGRDSTNAQEDRRIGGGLDWRRRAASRA
ncbi:hypothetical protein NDU88_007664 [Pleurodeles waltl]|uniref:Uncharacterized protein n=1 Tax=Pleurodeles waltl TaxID=8319 RepID=A0AAV7SSY5_PLEWA|nr:hypothetical protein NDU88_007664 [Pleurodeles waltl]